MSVTVTLFKGISPNYGKHYKFFTSYAEYIRSLGDYYKRYTLTDDRISDNQIIFSAAENVDAAEVSYCYINRNDGTSNQAYYFYHVTSGSVRGGMAFLQIELDVWATYLQRVNFGEIYVERCNRAIFSNGLYDDTNIATSSAVFSNLGNFEATNTTLAIVYVLNVAIDAQIFGNNVTRTIIYASNLKMGSDTNYTFEQVCGIVGGIYSYAFTNIAGVPITTNASTLRAYIVPLNALDLIANTSDYFYSRLADKDTQIKPQYIVRPGRIVKNFNIPAFASGYQYVGTKTYCQKIPRFIADVNVYYEYITGQAGLTVNIGIGDKKTDISNAFELDLTTNDSGFTTAEKISHAIDLIGKGGDVVKNYYEGNALGVISGAANFVTSAFNMGEQNFRQNAGDASSTFYNKSNINYNSPYILSRYTPILPPGRNAREHGAIFNSIYTEPLVTIFNSALLGVGPPNSTYIQGDIDCYGAQKDVIDFFVQRFREGVYLEKI